MKDIQTIKNKYFKNSIGDITDGDITELSLRYNKKEKNPDWELNNVIEIASTILIIEGTNKKGIIVQRDINNNPEPNKNLTIESLKKILQESAEKLTEKSVKALLI